MGVREKEEFVTSCSFTCPGVKFKSEKPSEELNITSELVNRVLETIKSNKLTRELLRVCNIKKIHGYTYRYEKRASVILVSERLKCEIIIRLDLTGKEKPKHFYRS